jgi:hypothetical protein
VTAVISVRLTFTFPLTFPLTLTFPFTPTFTPTSTNSDKVEQGRTRSAKVGHGRAWSGKVKAGHDSVTTAYEGLSLCPFGHFIAVTFKNRAVGSQNLKGRVLKC